jgi:non-heme chloroperoxidase
MTMRLFVLAALLALTVPAQAQDISGTWQGATNHQYVLKVSRAPHGGFHGRWYALGPERAGSPLSGDTASSVRIEDHSVTFTIDQTLDTFTGTLSADGNSIVGKLTCCWGPQKPQPMTLNRVDKKDAWIIDASPHKTQFVTVEKDVRLEVLDWGGNGPPLLFLAGLGDTGHTFDDFAPKFTATHHVYAITRRGFGASSVPAPTTENYAADRLADDVLAVIDALKLGRPVVAGHSIAGEELASIGTRHPEKVAGLIYLDAISSSRTFYTDGTDTYEVDIAMLRHALDVYLGPGDMVSDARNSLDAMLALMPRLEKEMASVRDQLQGVPDGPWTPYSPQQAVVHAIGWGERRYGAIKAPALALVPAPPACGNACDSPGAKMHEAQVTAFADAFAAGNPTAHVVRLAHASHFLWRSNEADVLREMNAFMDALPH